jgi:hypothetical protein
MARMDVSSGVLSTDMAISRPRYGAAWRRISLSSIHRIADRRPALTCTAVALTRFTLARMLSRRT